MRRLVVFVTVLLALALPAAAAAKVRLISVTSPVATGSLATLTVAVSPAATCSISVYYSTTASRAHGLSPKHGTRVSWTWKVGSRTAPGRWPIVVSCGAAGKLKTSSVVR